MERLTLLRYFAQYMDENLTEGGDSQQQQEQASTTPSTSPVHRRRSFVHMKRWVRTPKAIIMQLDNNTLQVKSIYYIHSGILFKNDNFCWCLDQLFQRSHQDRLVGRHDLDVGRHPVLGNLHQQ
jgi:hypothetical protein